MIFDTERDHYQLLLLFFKTLLLVLMQKSIDISNKFPIAKTIFVTIELELLKVCYRAGKRPPFLICKPYLVLKYKNSKTHKGSL